MMIKKNYSKKGRSCRVTFSLPHLVNAETVSLLGEFNDWNPASHPMKLRKNGSFSTTISLKPGQEYRFRYLLDGERWENDWEADNYKSNPYGSEDSVVLIPLAEDANS